MTRQEKALKAIQHNIDSQQHQLSAAETRHKQLQAQLKKNEHSIARITQKIQQLKTQKTRVQKRRKALYKEIKQLESKKEQQKKQLAHYMKLAYIQSKAPSFIHLFGEQPQSADKIAVYYQYLNKARAQHIKSLEQTKAVLNQSYAKIKKQHATLQALQAQYQDQTQALTTSFSDRKQTLDTLHRHIAQHKSQLEFLQVEEAQIKQILKESKQHISAEKMRGLKPYKGKLPWPTRGTLKARYGQRRSGLIRWKGIMLQAPEGRKIKSIAAGQVIFADWIKGLGMLTIVDHGEGFMSLYGHAQTLLKQVGEYVSAKDTLALVGRSGGLEKPHLYFEIRHKGQAINPHRYLKRTR